MLEEIGNVLQSLKLNFFFLNVLFELHLFYRLHFAQCTPIRTQIYHKYQSVHYFKFLNEITFY